MKATVFPGHVSGTITIPPSKSMAHRAILCASLAHGTSLISNVDYSEDILATIDCMRRLGATITEIENDKQSRNTLEIIGIDNITRLPDTQLHCQESGSTLRFLIPLVALSASKTEFLGRNRLLYRPQSVYEEIFLAQGLPFIHTTKQIEVTGPLRPADFTVRGDVSSQFISGLLMALPLLQQDSSLLITYPYESQSYVDLTIMMLAHFGVGITQELVYDGQNIIGHRYMIQGNQTFQAKSYRVEGDFSQLAFFAVLGAIHSPLTCIGMNHHSKQGDRAILDILRQCGAQVDEIDDGYVISPGDLMGATIDIKDCPDLGPILMVLGTHVSHSFQLINTARLRIKESNRGEAMAAGLEKLGVVVEVNDNDIVLFHDLPMEPTLPIEVSGYRDHRIVMSFAIAAASGQHPITISEAQSISKSYPRFFEDLTSLGIEVAYHD